MLERTCNGKKKVPCASHINGDDEGGSLRHIANRVTGLMKGGTADTRHTGLMKGDRSGLISGVDEGGYVSGYVKEGSPEGTAW